MLKKLRAWLFERPVPLGSVEERLLLAYRELVRSDPKAMKRMRNAIHFMATYQRDKALTTELRAIGVDVAFVDRKDRVVTVVVREHGEVSYERLLELEISTGIEIRVRAHQGRPLEAFERAGERLL